MPDLSQAGDLASIANHRRSMELLDAAISYDQRKK
jgi:hypothetical protein